MLHSHKLKDKEKAEVTQAMEKAIGYAKVIWFRNSLGLETNQTYEQSRPLLLSDFPIHAHRYVFQRKINSDSAYWLKSKEIFQSS